MQRRSPFSLFIVLAVLALLVIWIPVLELIVTGAESVFSVQTWLILSTLASLGIALLFSILYLMHRRR